MIHRTARPEDVHSQKVSTTAMRPQTNDTLRLLEELHDYVVQEPRWFFGNIAWGINQDEVTIMIAKVRSSMPQEARALSQNVRDSERVLETAQSDAHMIEDKAKTEAERIVRDAKDEAERLLEQARLQQRNMVLESEILKLSKSEAEQIRGNAEQDAASLKRSADQYALDVLNKLEAVVSKAVHVIDKGKQELQPTPLPKSQTAAATVKEKMRNH